MTGVPGDLDDTELVDMNASYLASGLRAMSAYSAIGAEVTRWLPRGLMTPRHGQSRRAGAALGPGKGRAGLTTTRGRPSPHPSATASQDALARQETTHITRVMPTAPRAIYRRLFCPSTTVPVCYMRASFPSAEVR